VTLKHFLLSVILATAAYIGIWKIIQELYIHNVQKLIYSRAWLKIAVLVYRIEVTPYAFTAFDLNEETVELDIPNAKIAKLLTTKDVFAIYAVNEEKAIFVPNGLFVERAFEIRDKMLVSIKRLKSNYEAFPEWFRAVLQGPYKAVCMIEEEIIKG